jgi:hypothetical protein
MRHTLKLNGIIVGHSELEEVDAVDRRVWGQFHPGFGYELVQPIFRLFSEATPMPGGEPRDQIKLAQYFAARDKLPLQLVDHRGRPIKTAAIHIADYSEERGPEAMSLDVLIADDGYWEERDG